MGTPVYHTEKDIPLICRSDEEIPALRPEEDMDITLRILRTDIGEMSALCSNLKYRIDAINENMTYNLTDFEKLSVQAVSSIYAIDEDMEKVKALREALFDVWNKAYENRCTGWFKTEGVTEAVKYILEQTIICGDFEKGITVSGEPVILAEWCHFHRVQFSRIDVKLEDVKKEIFRKYREYPWMDYNRIHKITKPSKIDGIDCE